MQTTSIRQMGLVVFTLAWLAYDHYRPWTSFHSEMLALVGLCLLLAGFFFGTRDSIPLPRTAAWIGLVAAWPWLQYLSGVVFFVGDAFVSSLYLLALLGAVVLGYTGAAQAHAPGKFQLAIAHSLWLAALASAAIGLAQWLSVQDSLGMYVTQTDLGDRAMGNLAQPNQLATLLLMGMMALTFVYQQQVMGRLGWVLAMVFMTLVLVMTGSRAGMLSVFVLTVFLLWKSRSSDLGVTPLTLAVWALGFVAGTLSLPLLADALLLGGGRSVASLTQSNERLVMWSQTLHGIWASPWIGYGWNQTPTAHMAGALVLPGAETFTYAHNLVLDLVAWNGLPLGLLLSGAIAYWFVSRSWRARDAQAVYAMAALLALAVHSMVEYPFAYAYFLIAAGFLIGVVEAAAPAAKTMRLNATWSRWFLVAWMALGGLMIYEYFLIEEDFRVVRFENLKIGKTPEIYEVPQVRVLSHLASMLKAARVHPQPGMSAEALDELRRVAMRFPYGSVTLRYALALGLNGDPQGAALQMRVIRGLYGERFYRAAKTAFRDLEKEKYPQLATVTLP